MSHNTMSAFHSSVDDKSDLAQPGMHLVVGRIGSKNRYEVCVSIVQKGERHVVSADKLVDLQKPTAPCSYHPSVKSYIVRSTQVVKPSKFVQDDLFSSRVRALSSLRSFDDKLETYEGFNWGRKTLLEGMVYSYNPKELIEEALLQGQNEEVYKTYEQLLDLVELIEQAEKNLI